MTAATASLSSVSLLLTCFLALCSAAVFLLLYLRPVHAPHPHGRQHSSPTRARRHSHGLKQHRPASLSLPRSSAGYANGHSHSPVSPYSPLLLPIPVVPKPAKPATTAATAGKKQSAASASAAAVSSSPSTLHLHFNPLSVPVIVTVASTPARLPHLLPTLQSLKQQSYPIHRILVCLPPSPPSGPALPDRLSRDPVIAVLRSASDYGPLGRLVEAGRWLADRGGAGGGGGECWVVSVEEGVVYHRDTVAELVRHGVEMDGCVVGTAGYRLLGDPWVMSNVAYVRRWDERLMEEWEDEDEEAVAEEAGWRHVDEEEPSKSKPANGRHKPKSASLSTRKSLSRSHHAADSPLSSHHNPSHPSAHSHLHSSLHTSHSPSASPHSPLLYPVEPCDVLSSFRAILFPPNTLPQPALLAAHLHAPTAHTHTATHPSPPRTQHCPDELLSGLLSLHGVGRVCLLTPLPVVQCVVDGKRGRGGGGVAEWMAWSELMEWMVRAGWWPGWDVADDSGAGGDERKTTGWSEGGQGEEGGGESAHGLIEEGETPAAGEAVGGVGGGDRGEGEDSAAAAAGATVNGGGKEKEERKEVGNGTSHAAQRVKAVMSASGQ